MMKMRHRVMSLLLAVTLLFSAIPIAPHAATVDEDTSTTEPIKVSTIGQSGTLSGISNRNNMKITYLSSLYSTDAKKYSYVVPSGGSTTPRDFTLDKNFFGTQVYVYTTASSRLGVLSGKSYGHELGNGYREVISGTTVHCSDIAIGILGINGNIYDKGLSFMPSLPDSSKEQATVIFDISDYDAEYFYAVVGMTGEGNNPKYTANSTQYPDKYTLVNFELYGSTAEEYSEDADVMNYQKLAYCNGIRAYLMGEFDIPISGYNFIKLVAVSVGKTNTNSESVWADACVYKSNSVSTSVTFEGDEGNTANRPEITVQLNQNGTAMKTATLNSYNNWRYEWMDLPFNDSEGTAYTYTVTTQTTRTPYYDISVGDDNKNITAIYAAVNAETSIEWKDDAENDRPESVTVSLYANEAKTNENITLTANDDWKATFSNLPKYDENDNVITYSVRVENGETIHADYYVDVTLVDNTCNITAKYNWTSMDVSITWNDNDNDKEKRPESVTVPLYANNEKTDKTVTLNADEGWKATISGLTKYDNYGKEIKYTIVAPGVSYYNLTVDGNAITATYTGSKSVNVSINWKENGYQRVCRPASVTVTLYANDGTTGESVTLNEENGWAASFDNLKENDNSGTPINYTVQADVTNYDVEIKDGIITCTCNVANEKFVTSFPVDFEWSNDEDHEADRSYLEFISITLSNGNSDNDATYSIQKNADGTFSYTFENLPKYSSYISENDNIPYNYTLTVNEESKFYNFSVENGTITATYIPMVTVDFHAKVVFHDENNAAGLRPDSVKLWLYANGKKTETSVALSANGSWTSETLTLAMYTADREKEIEYIFKTDSEIVDYVVSDTSSSANVCTITLKCEAKITAAITWDCDNDQVPSAHTVFLYQNGIIYGKQKLSSENEWSYTWESLPVWDKENSKRYEYVVYTAAPDNFNVSIDGGNITLTYEKSNATKFSTVGSKYSEQIKGYDYYLNGKTNISLLSDLVNGRNRLVTGEYSVNGDWKAFVNADSKLQVFIDGRQKTISEKMEVNGTTYSPTDIALGYKGKIFSDGLSAMASSALDQQSSITFDLSKLNVDRFYALVGITGHANDANIGPNGTKNNTEYTLQTFEVWGSKNGTDYVKLAYAMDIRSYLVAEFDVDITGYKYLKLVTVNTGSSNKDAAFAWADACVYSASTGNDSNNDNKFDCNAYTASTDGSYSWISKVKDGVVTYLSSLTATGSSNSTGNKPTTNNYPYGEEGKTITIGEKDTTFEYGLGVHPNSGTGIAYTTYDLTNLDVDRFYAAVGITNAKGKAGNSEGVYFEVYADYDGNGNYVLIAKSEDITKKDSGEFNCDITGAKSLKLVVMSVTGNHASSGSAWANACVYKYDATGTVPGGSDNDTGNDDNTGDNGNNDNKFDSNAYTASTDGSYSWISKVKDGVVTYLSSLTATGSSNSTGNKPTTNNYPYGEEGKTITIGEKDTTFEYGLGVHPNSGTSIAYTTYDLTNLDVDRFYAAVGITNAKGKAGNSEGVYFEVYADYDGNGNYVLIAKSEDITKKDSGEFNCDITGAKSLKLVIMSVTGNHASSGSAWANACVYKYDANGKIPASNTSSSGNSNNSGSIGDTPDNTTLKPSAGFTTSENGDYVGVPKENGSSIIYLTALDWLESSNTTNTTYPSGQPTTLNHPFNSTSDLITIGQIDRVFFKGLGMHPKNPSSPVDGSIESWTIFDISELDCDRFYSVVGLTNSKGKEGASKGVVFKVYGDYEGNGNYMLLAHSGCIAGYASGEFDVDITGVKTLKLVVVCASTTHTSSASGWGNVCVYNSKSVSDTGSSTTPTDPTNPAEPTVPDATTESTEITIPTDTTEPTEPSDSASSPVKLLVVGIVIALIAVVGVIVFLLKKKQIF